MDKQLPGFDSTDVVALLLLFLELYLTIPHVLLLFRIRMQPREDLTKHPNLTLLEITLVLGSAIYIQKGLWLAAIHAIGHGFYFTFSDHWYSKKVRVIPPIDLAIYV